MSIAGVNAVLAAPVSGVGVVVTPAFACDPDVVLLVFVILSYVAAVGKLAAVRVTGSVPVRANSVENNTDPPVPPPVPVTKRIAVSLSAGVVT